MADEKNESVAEFLNGLTETSEPFKEEVVTEEREQGKNDDNPLPFYKDPKIQRYIEKQVEKKMESMSSSSVEQQFRQEVKEELNLPESFVKLVGNDTDEKKQVLKDLSNYFGTLKGEARKEFLEEMKEQERQVVAQDQAALNELTTGFETIEEEHGIDLSKDSKTRAAFIEFLRKASHKNDDGEVDQFADIPSTWELFQERQNHTPSNNRAKEIASRGMTRSNDVSTTSQGFKSGTRDPWQQVDQHFAKITKNN